jgi:hypothetical protein
MIVVLDVLQAPQPVVSATLARAQRVCVFCRTKVAMRNVAKGASVSEAIPAAHGGDYQTFA